MARMIKTFIGGKEPCFRIAPEKQQEGSCVIVEARPDAILIFGNSMSLVAARQLREALALAIIVAEGMESK